MKKAQLLPVVFVVLLTGGIGFFSYYQSQKASKDAQQRADDIRKKVGKVGLQNKKPNFDDLPKAVQELAKMSTKQGHFVDCGKSLERSRASAQKRYASWIKDGKVGPTGKERSVYGIYKISGLDACQKSMLKASLVDVKSKPLNELQTAMDAYLKVMEKMVKLVDAMHQYYKDEDFKDDKFVKAKTFHKQYMAYWAQLGPMVRKYHRIVDDVEDDLSIKKMAFFKGKYGEKVRYLMIRMRYVAKRFVVPVVRRSDDALKVRDRLNELVEVQKKLATEVKANKEHIKENVFGKRNWSGMSNLESLVKNTREFITAGKKYTRALEKAAGNKKKLAKFFKNAFHWAHGSGTAVINKYNQGIAGLRLSVPW